MNSSDCTGASPSTCQLDCWRPLLWEEQVGNLSRDLVSYRVCSEKYHTKVSVLHPIRRPWSTQRFRLHSAFSFKMYHQARGPSAAARQARGPSSAARQARALADRQARGQTGRQTNFSSCRHFTLHRVLMSLSPVSWARSQLSWPEVATAFLPVWVSDNLKYWKACSMAWWTHHPSCREGEKV